LPLSFFKKNRSGDLLARLMNDTEVLRQVIAQASSDLIKQPATLLAALGVLGWLAARDRSFFIALIALVTVPLCVTVIRMAGKRLAARARTLQARGGDLSATLTETLQSPLEIRAYNLEERQIAQFRLRVREMLGLALKVVKYRQAISPSIEVVAATGFAAALFFGVRNGMTLEGFMTLGMALYMSYEPIKKLGVIHSLFRQGDAAIERLEFILGEVDGLPDPAEPQPFHAPRQGIRFENVSFAYEDELVLQDVDLEIPSGTVVALVGPSGAGKSTFASLIPRFYDPTRGAITIDGTDLRRFSKKELREHIAVVPQTPSLFSGSVADNIRIGRLDASDERIVDAARRAHADEFIRGLPEGYQTQVGERGDQLSGGQRQRIAIARAFLRDAPILILDEATSALDSESESMVQQALADLVKGRTTFIIAHRFSTITVADRVLVFEGGRIVADGSHAELRGSSPIYQAMMG
jgi:ATP-binding cassette, subfamily B, bacterial MsbA